MGGMAAEPRLGTRIRRARERRRWTQQRLADELGVSLRAVGDWENDRAYPRNSVGALEEKLGVDLSSDTPAVRLTRPTRNGLRKELTADEYARVMETLGLPPDE
jgi:transcriptional regulator with XRE-family HTH domain